jgi:hypothetical protein
MLCKIWDFHCSDYEECRLLGYKNPVRTSRETHYVSATEHSRLMLCKIWGFHGGDCEECRYLGYKNPVRTSQGIHYISRYSLHPVNAMYDLRFARWRLWRIPSSGMLRRVAFVRTDVSEERRASIIRVIRIGELGRTLAVTSNRHTLQSNKKRDGGDKFLRNVGSLKSHTA